MENNEESIKELFERVRRESIHEKLDSDIKNEFEEEFESLIKNECKEELIVSITGKFEDQINYFFEEIIKSGAILMSRLKPILENINPIINDKTEDCSYYLYIDPKNNNQGVMFTKFKSHLIISLNTEFLNKDIYLKTNHEIYLHTMFEDFYNIDFIK